jgi:hypothetical protein
VTHVVRGVVLFLAWAIVGFFASWLLLYGFTPLGLPLWLGALLSYRYLPRIGDSRRHEAFGALAGFGLFCLVLAHAADPGYPLWLVATSGIAIGSSIGSYIILGRRRCVLSAANQTLAPNR